MDKVTYTTKFADKVDVAKDGTKVAWLPLGLRVLRKIEAVVREEMNRMGGQEVHFPALLPADPYKATGRWQEYGPTLFTLVDRRGNDYLLAPTHEEVLDRKSNV